jgi:hypothetical protein
MALPDTWPSGEAYDAVPDRLRDIIRRSYRERDDKNQNLAHGFEGAVSDPNPQDTQPFKAVLDRLMARSSWKVLIEVFNRCKQKIPTLWDNVKWLNEFYDYKTSRGVWVCFDPAKINAAHQLLKKSDRFCGDMKIGQSMHQSLSSGPLPSQCYRELGVLKEDGLHVCMIVTAKKASAFGEWQNIHIDPHQIGSEKGTKCACWYKNVQTHMNDVGKWCCEQIWDKLMADPKGKAAITALAALGVPLSNAGDLYKLVDSAVGSYDTFVDMADNPSKYFVTIPTSTAELKRNAVVTLAIVYKKVYMEYMPPEFDVGP